MMTSGSAMPAPFMPSSHSYPRSDRRASNLPAPAPAPHAFYRR